MIEIMYFIFECLIYYLSKIKKYTHEKISF